MVNKCAFSTSSSIIFCHDFNGNTTFFRWLPISSICEFRFAARKLLLNYSMCFRCDINWANWFYGNHVSNANATTGSDCCIAVGVPRDFPLSANWILLLHPVRRSQTTITIISIISLYRWVCRSQMKGQKRNKTLTDRQRKGSEEQKLELVTEYISVVAKAQSSGTGPSTEKRALRSTFSRDSDQKIMKAIRHTFTICWTNSKTASTTQRHTALLIVSCIDSPTERLNYSS